MGKTHLQRPEWRDVKHRHAGGTAQIPDGVGLADYPCVDECRNTDGLVVRHAREWKQQFRIAEQLAAAADGVSIDVLRTDIGGIKTAHRSRTAGIEVPEKRQRLAGVAVPVTEFAVYIEREIAR